MMKMVSFKSSFDRFLFLLERVAIFAIVSSPRYAGMGLLEAINITYMAFCLKDYLFFLPITMEASNIPFMLERMGLGLAIRHVVVESDDLAWYLGVVSLVVSNLVLLALSMRRGCFRNSQEKFIFWSERLASFVLVCFSDSSTWPRNGALAFMHATTCTYVAGCLYDYASSAWVPYDIPFKLERLALSLAIEFSKGGIQSVRKEGVNTLLVSNLVLLVVTFLMNRSIVTDEEDDDDKEGSKMESEDSDDASGGGEEDDDEEESNSDDESETESEEDSDDESETDSEEDSGDESETNSDESGGEDDEDNGEETRREDNNNPEMEMIPELDEQLSEVNALLKQKVREISATQALKWAEERNQLEARQNRFAEERQKWGEERKSLQLQARLDAAATEKENKFAEEHQKWDEERKSLCLQLRDAQLKLENYFSMFSEFEERLSKTLKEKNEFEETCSKIIKEQSNLRERIEAESLSAEHYNMIANEYKERSHKLEEEKTKLTASLSASKALNELYRGYLHDLGSEFL